MFELVLTRGWPQISLLLPMMKGGEELKLGESRFVQGGGGGGGFRLRILKKKH